MAATFRSGAFVVDVSTSTAVGGAFSVINPEGVALVITQAILDISANSSSTGTMNIGLSTAAASTATVLLFDAVTTTAGNPLSNHSSGNAGTAGVPAALWSSGGYLTGSHSNAQGASLAADLIVHYYRRAT